MPVLSDAARDSRTGSKAASVLPEPVGATMRTSEPARITAMAATCIGLSCEIPMLRSISVEVDSPALRICMRDKAFQKRVLRNKVVLKEAESRACRLHVAYM